MPRALVLGLIACAFALGSVLGALRFGVAEASAAPDQRFAYFCFEAGSVEEVNVKANAAGLRGWEMVTAAAGGNNPIWCFRQRK